MSPGQVVAMLVFGALMFVAGRRSVRRRVNAIRNVSGHRLVIRLDDSSVLHIESGDE